MIPDPAARGRALAEFAASVIERLWSDLESSGMLPSDASNARWEWRCFALYACVRGLVAAGGFNRETAAAIDALHESMLERWAGEGWDEFDRRRAMIAERYSEYGSIGQEGGASGAATVTRRLGEACARHLASPAAAGAGTSAAPRASDDPGALAELIGGMHEALAEGSAEAVRIAT